MEHAETVVSYIRVSTQKQGRPVSGWRRSARPSPGSAKAEGFVIAGEHVEVETGKGADALERRPKLAAALKAARKLKGR